MERDGVTYDMELAADRAAFDFGLPPATEAQRQQARDYLAWCLKYRDRFYIESYPRWYCHIYLRKEEVAEIVQAELAERDKKARLEWARANLLRPADNPNLLRPCAANAGESDNLLTAFV